MDLYRTLIGYVFSTAEKDESTSGTSNKTETTTPHKTDLYGEIPSNKWPIIYASDYNIGFLGLEKLHPFDAGKWGRVHTFLKEAGMVKDDTTVKPREASEKDLMVVHSKEYISSLKWSVNVASITEVPPVALLPNFIVQRKVLRPFRYQTGGTIMAGKLAMERGWSLNIGGGFHHCCSEKGGGFCAYADITLAIKFLFERVQGVSKAMIIDLDAHQGNGHERDFIDDDRVYILDVYNRGIYPHDGYAKRKYIYSYRYLQNIRGIYPHDGYAKRAIKKKVELRHFTEDDEYLELVSRNIDSALGEFEPDIVIYNAGTDILQGDPLGNLSITEKGIIERDKIVFEKVRSRNIPILMVTSGGYQRSTARIIADSVLNLRKLKLIGCDEAELANTQSKGWLGYFLG
ncbi:hypothetical protein FSP39_005453 [Pinctada imbricata]|uniref:Histone deacetylase domain-containing protein n=1 Tax=Pinctada imbricata TaxID=66713 RepID=A0AA89BYS7_PINIB|nr:hypothetical protein FSP39_005453 [Pinctada imbricata]